MCTREQNSATSCWPETSGLAGESDVGANCRDLELRLNVIDMRNGNRRLFLYGVSDLCRPSYLS